MGIRLNVVITMVKADYDKIVSLAQDTGDKNIIEVVTTIPDAVETFVGVDSDGDDIELVRISYVSVKWDDWYKDVMFVEGFLGSRIPYHFLTTHECNDIPEERSNLECELNVVSRVRRRIRHVFYALCNRIHLWFINVFTTFSCRSGFGTTLTDAVEVFERDHLMAALLYKTRFFVRNTFDCTEFFHLLKFLSTSVTLPPLVLILAPVSVEPHLSVRRV